MKGTTATTVTGLILLAVIQAAMGDNSTDPRSFFPSINGNLMKIVWAHAVNSQSNLEKALASGDIMMLEADVSVGRQEGSSTNETAIPIMAHPPAKESDLTLEAFLGRVTEKNSTKGIKLDFKSIEAFELSKPLLEKIRDNLKFPVFINADIYPGPVNSTDSPVDANSFITGAMKTLPNCILSIGWKTRYGTEFNITEGRYTNEQVKQMVDAVKESKVTLPITYPVRAGLAANDIEIMKALLKNTSDSNNATLTIWSSEGDNVDAKKLSKLIKEVGVEKVYVDVPDDLMKKIDTSSASTLAATLLMSLGPLLITLIISRML